MKKSLKKILLGLLALFCLLATACGTQESGGTSAKTEEPAKSGETSTVEIEGISFDPDEKTVELDSRYLIDARVEPSGADVDTLSWTSSDESIISIEDQFGAQVMIHAKSVGGPVEITCQAPNGEQATIAVTVKGRSSSASYPDAGTTDGREANDEIGDTEIYHAIESFDVETPEIETVMPSMP